MPGFSPALIQTMRAVLDEVITKIPPEQATSGIKAALAECILRSAGAGQTSYEGLLASVSEQIQFILSTMIWSAGARYAPDDGAAAYDSLDALSCATPSGRSPDWLKFNNPAAPAVKREAEEDWNCGWRLREGDDG
jgi:hypothetical protein